MSGTAVCQAGHLWDGMDGFSEGRESDMRGELKRDIQSHGLVSGK